MSIANQAQRVLGACAVLLPALLSACGDDESGGASLTLLTPSDGQILTLEDDTEPDEPGLQLDVTGRSGGLRVDTPIELYVDGAAHGATGEVGEGGAIELPSVTLAPGEHTIYLRTAVGSVQSDDEHAYTFRALVIALPEDGDVVGVNQDEDDDEEGIQFSVQVQAFAIESDDDIALFADGEQIATAARDADGTAAFAGITLPAGEHTLEARVGSGADEIVSEDVTIEVLEGEPPPPAPACEGVALLSPTAPGSGAIVLGGADCDADDHVTTDVRLSIAESDGMTAELRLNGDVVGSAEVEDGEVEFTDVEISEASGNSLVLAIGDDACAVTSRDIQLDCAAPRCVIRAPEPLEVGGTLYLSSQQQVSGGFNFEVEADDEADGEEIELVVDDGAPELATAVDVAGDIVAQFNGLTLADGPHTVSATCRDANGNTVTTPVVEFVVDTTPCVVDITAPANGTVFLPNDDTTAGTAGVQVPAITAVTGGDCVAVRYGLCPDGDLTGDFAEFDGESPHTAVLTLADSATSQSYCVDVRDHVGNLGGDTSGFMFRQVEPMVSIVSPATGTSFNAAGGDGYVTDAVPGTTLCEADVVVACEVGTDVELRHDDADGPLIATVACVADDGAPDGFDGLATFDDAVISDASGDQATTIVATQTFSGTSTSLTGVSTAVTYNTDCQAPVVVATNTPCSLHASQQITDEEAADFVIELSDSSADTTSAELSYWTGLAAGEDPLGTPTGTQSGMVAGAADISFTTIDFGDLGPLVVAVVLEDDFGNTTQYLCQSEIVDELPSITVVQWPADGAEYGPGDSECDPIGAGEYGIQIEVEIDSAADRTASLTVNGEVIEDELTIVGTTIEYCVPLPDDSENTPPGPSTVNLRVEEIAGNGFDFVERDVSVHTILITDPVEDQLIVVADDCDPGAGFGYEVSVDVDPMHNESAYTLQADAAAITGTVSGTTITACVPVTLGGERTITASIDSTDIEHSVTVNVVNDVPMIVSIDAPADGADFGVGDQTCVAAGVGTYGVRFQATVDQADNREADVLVNGMLAAENVAIGPGGAIDVCVDVPDNLENDGDPTTITLNLSNVLGAPMTDTDSVEIDVDTLDIVDPVADQLITAVDDCDMGAGFGYEVEIAVDESHLGQTYSIIGGGLASTGVIMDDVITACVALTPATGAVITASITGTPISESLTVDVEDAPPAIIAITAPANNATFGPGGQTCATGVAGTYGVRVQATLDQTLNRVASVLVNGAVAVADATITGAAIDECVAVPDNRDNPGPSTIQVRLEEEPGDRFDTEMVTVNVDKLDFTAPTANQHFVPMDDCDPGVGFGIPVSIAVDASLSGASYVVDGGGADLTGTVAGATITGCLAVTSATTAIAASITGTLITETVPVTVFTGGPPTMALTFTRACPDPTSSSYREDDATLTWGDLGAFENYAGQFATLQMRCAHLGLATGQTNDAWWTAATPYALPGTVTVASTGMDLPFRIGEGRFCALRASNSALEQTPAPAPVNVTCGFRSTLLYTGTVDGGGVGASSAPLGDVNGDGIGDVMIGGLGGAFLVLGRNTAFTGTPTTSFTSGAVAADNSVLGFEVTGLGDINDDGLQDFAIGDAGHDIDLGNRRGRMYVFFGRETWPATVTLGTQCGADLCFDHTGDNARLSLVISGVGDFDGDAIDDIGVTASNFPMDTSLGQFFVLRGGAYERRACTVPGDCRATETCTEGFCALNAGQTFWGLQYELPSGDWINTPSGTPVAGRVTGFVIEGVTGTEHSMGRGVAALGAFDTTAGTDLVIAATGRSSAPAVQSKLFFLSGRAHSGGAGMDTLTIASLGFRDSGGTPSGTPFHTTTTGVGTFMTASGNIYDVPGAGVTGVRDILVKRSGEQGFYIYPGDRNFLSTDRITVQGVNASDLGSYFTMGYSPALPANLGLATPDLLTDFDGDGRSDFAAGARGPATGTAGAAYLFYADALNTTNIVGGVLSYTHGSSIEPAGAPGTSYQNVEAAGDLNADGHPDLIIGHREANAFAGEVFLLY